MLNKNIKIKPNIFELNPFQSKYGRVLDIKKGGLLLVQWDDGGQGFIHVNNVEVR